MGSVKLAYQPEENMFYAIKIVKKSRFKRLLFQSKNMQ